MVLLARMTCWFTKLFLFVCVLYQVSIVKSEETKFRQEDLSKLLYEVQVLRSQQENMECQMQDMKQWEPNFLTHILYLIRICYYLRSVVVKQELSQSSHWSIYSPVLTYGHEIWVGTERIRSRIQATEIRFLCRFSVITLCDRVRSSAIPGYSNGLSPWGRPRSHWRDYIFQLDSGHSVDRLGGAGVCGQG